MTPTSVAASSSGVEEIIVTAQRRTERLQDVPVSVTVTSGQSLERGNVRSVQDFASRQPAFQVQQSPTGDQLFIRGTGSGANAAFEQSVGTFVDGLYRNRARSTRVALFDVERVEVLKGPQTTFFGANAIAGALNITTRKPGSQFEANATALYAVEDGEYNVEVGVGGPVTSNLGVRIAGRLSGMDGYITNEALGGKGPHNRDGQARAVVSWKPVDTLTIDARFDYARLRDTQTFNSEAINCTSGSVGANCQSAVAQNGGNPIDDRLNYHSDALGSFSNIDLYEGEVTGRLDLGAASLVSTTGYFRQDFLAQNNLVPTGDFPLGTSTNYGSTGERFTQFSQELRLESDAADRLQYIVGGYYEHYDLKFFGQTGNLSSIPPVGSRPALQAVGYTASDPIGYLRDAHQDSRTLSAFGSLKFKVTDALSIAGSLRYSDIRKTTDDLQSQYGIIAASGLRSDFQPGNAAQQAAIASIFGINGVFADHERNDHSFMPSASLQYKFTPNVMAYATYTHGFKAGGFGTTDTSTFDPEKVDSYEGGLKATLFDRKLQANLAVYRSNYTNLQESQSVVQGNSSTAVTIVTNAAKARTQGVDASLILRPDRQLTLSADIGYVDSKYLSYPNAPCYAGQTAAAGCVVVNSAGGKGQDLSGRTRYYSPKWSGNVSADYDIPLNDALELRLGGTLYFKSRYFIAPALIPASVQKGFSKTDLRATLVSRAGHWEAGVIAKNIFDKKTAAYFADMPLNAGSYIALADRPRSVAFSVSYRY